MSGCLNKVCLIGHLGADPESRSLGNGGDVVNLRLATSESWNDRDGNKQERTEWHRVVIFNENLGKIAKQYARKGSKLYIEGQLQTRKWQDQGGTDKYSTEIVLQKFNGTILLLGDQGGGRNNDRDDRGGGNGWGDDDRGSSRGGGGRDDGSSTGRNGGGGGNQYSDDLDDDVPFCTSDPAYEPGAARRRVI